MFFSYVSVVGPLRFTMGLCIWNVVDVKSCTLIAFDVGSVLLQFVFVFVVIIVVVQFCILNCISIVEMFLVLTLYYYKCGCDYICHDWFMVH